MKRQADNQITKDGHDDGSDDEGMPEQGMKKASEAELGRRAIRPLPSRNKSSVQPAATFPTPSNTGLFSNPSPFGLNPPNTGAANVSSSTSTFTGFSDFKTTTTDATSTTTFTSSTNNAFALPPASSSSSLFFKPSQPASTAPPAATSTSKTFASLLSSSGPNPFGPPSPASASTAPTASSPGKAQEESASVKYYKNLRGLNLSLVSAITKSVEADPYVDLTDALEKYTSYRSKAQVDFDSSKTNGSSSTSSEPLSTPTPPVPSTSKSTAMPAPPASFSGFGGFKLQPPTSTSSEAAAPSSTASNPIGFKPTNSVFGSSTASSPFSFPSESKEPKEPKAPTFGFGSSTSAPSLSSNTASSTMASSASFTFGSSSTSSSTPTSLFGGSFGTTPSQPSTSPSNPFGITASQTATSFTFGKPAEKMTEKNETTTNSNPFGVPEKSASTSLFSTSKPSTNSGSPFSFISSPSTSVFGKAESAPLAASAEDNTTEGETSERDTPAAEGDNATPALLSSNPLDEEGAGEENEETVHTIKAKAFKLSKDAEGAAKWLQLGTGMLRIKKDKESGARRVLLRNSTNGKVIVNFKIYSALKPTQNKAALSFIGHDDGAPQTYSIRLAKEEDAKNLKDVLDREITFVKAKETS